MPKYDYACEECGHVQEEIRTYAGREEKGTCRECGGTSHYRFSFIGRSTFAFRPRWFEHIAPTPTFVSSQRELDRVCKENESYVMKDDRVKERKFREKVERYEKKMKAKGVACG